MSPCVILVLNASLELSRTEGGEIIALFPVPLSPCLGEWQGLAELIVDSIKIYDLNFNFTYFFRKKGGGVYFSFNPSLWKSKKTIFFKKIVIVQLQKYLVVKNKKFKFDLFSHWNAGSRFSIQIMVGLKLVVLLIPTHSSGKNSPMKPAWSLVYFVLCFIRKKNKRK